MTNYVEGNMHNHLLFRIINEQGEMRQQLIPTTNSALYTLIVINCSSQAKSCLALPM